MKGFSHDFVQSRDALVEIGDRRVWSMIVTLFGDLAQNPNDRINGPLLSRIFEHLDIKPEAMRVAIHRLRKDGWIDVEKSGRTAIYRLSDHGRDQTVIASSRIYARQVEGPATWHVAMPNQMENRADLTKALLNKGYVSVNGGAFLGKGPKGEAAKDCFVITGDQLDIPDWLRDLLAPEGMKLAFERLEVALCIVQGNLRNGPKLTVMETTALRVLIVHNWRYLVLRSPDLPAKFFPGGWREIQCRALFHDVLGLLGRPTVSQMQKALG